MDLFRPPSVFSYFSPITGVPGAAGVRGPEFGSCRPPPRCAAPTSSTRWCSRRIAVEHQRARTAPRSICPRIAGARGESDAAGRRLNGQLLHGTMSTEMRQSIIGAVTAVAGHQPAQARPHRRLSRRDVVAVSGGEVDMDVTRREFMFQIGQAALATRSARRHSSPGSQRFSLINALAQGSDYKALVCVFLAGGNDGNNMVVPLEHDRVQRIRRGPQRVRARRSRSDALLPITPLSIGSPFGLHPSLAELQALWDSQKLSVVCNVGPLVAAADARAVPRRGAASLPAVLALRSGRAVADVDRRSRRANRVGRPDGRSLRAAAIGIPDGHRAIGRDLHARPDDARRCRLHRRRRR